MTMRRAAGRAEFLKHLKGERLTLGEAVKAKCFDCMCGYADGRVDCQVVACPLYRYMPYRNRGTESEIHEPASDKPCTTLIRNSVKRVSVINHVEGE